MTAITFTHHDASTGATLVDELVDVYLDVYADADPAFYNEDRFRQQVSGHMTAPAWELVTARSDRQLAGFAYGLALPPETRWWSGLVTDVPVGFTEETGKRTFALSELMVRKTWRGQGVAHRLHDELLSRRREERATLLVRTDNEVAQAAYARWGWQKVAQLRPSWGHAPLYDVLTLPLLPL
jgi:GNAT superfamily N-acetyltransferase